MDVSEGHDEAGQRSIEQRHAADRDGMDRMGPAVSEPMDDAARRPAPEVIDRVRASCAAVAERPVRLAEEFYRQLFAMAPAARGMFPPDLSGQMQKMTDALLAAIDGLGRGDTTELQAVLGRLGADHRLRYGVRDEHYLYIGHALTRAVREVAGAGWSGSLSSDWIGVYQWVARHMLAGAHSAHHVEPPAPLSTEPNPGAQGGAGTSTRRGKHLGRAGASHRR